MGIRAGVRECPFAELGPSLVGTQHRKHKFNSNMIIVSDWRTTLLKLSDHDLTITVTSDTIQPVSSVRDLGVKLDSELSMKQQVSNITRACFYHLRRLRQIRSNCVYLCTQHTVEVVLHTLTI